MFIYLIEIIFHAVREILKSIIIYPTSRGSAIRRGRFYYFFFFLANPFEIANYMTWYGLRRRLTYIDALFDTVFYLFPYNILLLLYFVHLNDILIPYIMWVYIGTYYNMHIRLGRHCYKVFMIFSSKIEYFTVKFIILNLYFTRPIAYVTQKV